MICNITQKYVLRYDVVHAALMATMSGHTSWVGSLLLYECLAELTSLSIMNQVLCVAFSPDNDHFVSGSSDGCVKVSKSNLI